MLQNNGFYNLCVPWKMRAVPTGKPGGPCRVYVLDVDETKMPPTNTTWHVVTQSRSIRFALKILTSIRRWPITLVLRHLAIQRQLLGV